MPFFATAIGTVWYILSRIKYRLNIRDGEDHTGIKMEDEEDSGFDDPELDSDTLPLVAEDKQQQPLRLEDTRPLVAEDKQPLRLEDTRPLVAEDKKPLRLEDTRPLVAEDKQPMPEYSLVKLFEEGNKKRGNPPVDLPLALVCVVLVCFSIVHTHTHVQ